ncbi:PREDICTED: C-type lectin domain family 12 member A-like [Dipodomys ordii]|uniref:C-type lectin domain family 12 member A-like n=1 Tax=Dipodomys ordii TaxID=10020 RepID=A0A1S3FVD7_DIPOR|nr:PREDICTED: C-type lectin domain family 12 member A-like [Dipodomys ordii]
MEACVYKQQYVQKEIQQNVSLQQMGIDNSSEKIQSLSTTVQTLATRLCHELRKKEPEHKCKPCPWNWLWHANRCYLLYYVPDTWKNSEKLCADRNASLLKINNKDTLEFVKSQELYDYWLGVPPRQDNRNYATANWRITSAIWLKSNTSGFKGKYCGYMTYDMYIFYDFCSIKKYAMCEKMADPVRVENSFMCEEGATHTDVNDQNSGKIEKLDKMETNVNILSYELQ